MVESDADLSRGRYDGGGGGLNPGKGGHSFDSEAARQGRLYRYTLKSATLKSALDSEAGSPVLVHPKECQGTLLIQRQALAGSPVPVLFIATPILKICGRPFPQD